ncbi:MAG TPA: 1-acyl-sn-glycerol-3-phosphate acyltransferase, partial [Bdellovibrionota bacterium]|nr:1-acyl-sn-glycerol-3-phosphate acyltransferase [Bdellovibrionota bacterium]
MAPTSREQPVNRSTGSHPAIRFTQLPITRGPLHELNAALPSILEDVVNRTVAEQGGDAAEWAVSEALYQERARLRRSKFSPFTEHRRRGDRRLWAEVQSGLRKSTVEVNRELLLRKVAAHYANEVAGHFNERVYWMATRAVPWGFNWLLNAASVQKFLPWGMSQALESRLRIVGHIPQVRKLAEKGTILLVPTHQSNIDSLLIGYVIYLMGLPPFAYGAGLNLFSNPVLNFFMSNLGAYTVDRQKNNQIYKNLLKHYSTRILEEGIHSIFFPGGGRS